MVQSAARVKPNGDLASVEAGPYALIAHMDGRRLVCAFFIAELRAMNWGIPRGITAFLLFW
jgi:hypothetical protein